ncbi:hypothetical protein PTI98_004411 [Pleurotus ostreatus]|nr:hypothetical protein PTI98_004411 [Pleurotus ostreatus]
MSIYHTTPSVIPEICALVFNLSGGAFMFGIVMAEPIMAVRIWALWGNSRTIGVFCVFALKGLVFVDTTSIAPNLPGYLRVLEAECCTSGSYA